MHFRNLLQRPYFPLLFVTLAASQLTCYPKLTALFTNTQFSSNYTSLPSSSTPLSVYSSSESSTGTSASTILTTGTSGTTTSSSSESTVESSLSKTSSPSFLVVTSSSDEPTISDFTSSTSPYASSPTLSSTTSQSTTTSSMTTLSATATITSGPSTTTISPSPPTSSASVPSTNSSSSTRTLSFSQTHTTSFSSSSSHPTSSSASSSTSSPSSSSILEIGKRGLPYSNNTFTGFFACPGQSSKVSWAYNYYSVASAGLNPSLDFVPMLYSNDPSLTSIWASNVNYSIANFRTRAVLAFNEPDSCYSGSACMNVTQAVSAYRNFMQPLAGQVLLGAPAVTSGGPPASLTYLSYFLGNCTDCTIDFVPIHWYNNPYAFGYLQYYVEEAYNISGGRPLWITEFGMDSIYYNDADVQSFMKTSLAWLDSLSYVKRYAWFGDYQGYLVNNAGTGLSQDGIIYNNYTTSYAGN